MKEITIFNISQDQESIRLDKWLKSIYPNIPQGMIEKLLRKKNIKVNSKPTKSSYRLKTGDKIEIKKINFEVNEKKKLPPKEISLKIIKEFKESILYEDDNIIIINKAQGIPVQGGSKVKLSINDILNSISNDNYKYKIVHRIDKDTSGILVIAKNILAAREITKLFKERKVKKTYLALVNGKLPKEKGTIIFPIAKIKEKVEVTEQGAEAITHYQMIKTNNNISLIKLNPITGRKHQLRVHMKAMNSPIVGDRKYNHKEFNYSENSLHLHASMIEFTDSSNKQITVEAPLPTHIKDTLTKLRISFPNS